MIFLTLLFLQVELHPRYDNVSSYYDIGIIYTDKDINFNEDVMPICLSNQPNSDVNFLASKSVHMAGWGRVADQSNVKRNELTLRHENELQNCLKMCGWEVFSGQTLGLD